MDQADFVVASEVASKIAKAVEDSWRLPELKPVRELLKQMGKVLSGRYCSTLRVTVEVADLQQSHSFPLAIAGLASSGGNEMAHLFCSIAFRKYIWDGMVKVVPHDRCPSCWQTWQSKLTNTTCPNCSVAMGDHVKLLLDNGVCPYCEEGSVSMSNPICDRCGCKVDPQFVVWG
jgi:ribosomal protein S27AE